MNNDFEERRKKTLIFLGQKDISTQTDTFIHSNIPNLCSACNKNLSNAQINCLNLSCDHLFCIDCLHRLVSEQIKVESNFEIQCPICTKPLNDSEIDKIDPQFTKTITNRFASQFGQTIICPSCKSDFILEPGAQAHITITKQGVKIRPEALECLRQYRVTCPICETCFCAKCKLIPFHEGFTCEEQKLLNDGIICRFCGNNPAIGCEKFDACHRVCWLPECQECLPQSCMHVCDCGHACCGIKDEQKHFGCAKCNGDVCVICGDSCTIMPSIFMECGHPVHKSCLEMQYQSCSEKGRIHIPRCYGYSCNCVPYHECVKDVAQRWKDIDKKVEEITKLRMEMDDIKNEQDHVKNPNDPDYFNQPLKFARDFYVFYICDKCKNPYFAGRKDCNDDNNNENDNGPHECLRCNRKLMNSICPKHGETGMVIKCMFCCNPSLFFCFGTTYFCEICHQRPGDVQRGPWPQCDGKCKFAPHPPNGERTISAYCVLCEQEKENEMINKH